MIINQFARPQVGHITQLWITYRMQTNQNYLIF